MKFDLRWLDIGPEIFQQPQPWIEVQRPTVNPAASSGRGLVPPGRCGEFAVAIGPLNTDPVRWATVRSGTSFRVPLFAYTTPFAAKSSLLAVGLEMGLRGALSLSLPTPPLEATIWLGRECFPAPEGGFRVALGLALRTQ